MASTREGFVSQLATLSSALSSEKGNHFLTVYKGLELALQDPKKSYQDKVSALLGAWEQLAPLSTTATKDDIEILSDVMYRDTLRLILHGGWKKLPQINRTRLRVTLQLCASTIRSPRAAPQCRRLLSLVDDPWGKTLTKVITGEILNDETALSLCLEDTPFVLITRLDTLCEQRCEDLAIRICTVGYNALKSESFFSTCTLDQRQHITDLYFVLLMKQKRKNDIVHEISELDLEVGVQLVERCIQRVESPSYRTLHRVWRSSLKVAELISQYLMASAMVRVLDEQKLKSLMDSWGSVQKHLNVSLEDLSTAIYKFVDVAESSLHLYIMCRILEEKFGDKLKPLCVELYVRGLTADMNHVEQQKLRNETEKIREGEVRLAEGFMLLSNNLQDKISVCRECVLTAFSLHPTSERLQRLRELAESSEATDEVSSTSEIQTNAVNSTTTPIFDTGQDSSNPCDSTTNAPETTFQSRQLTEVTPNSQENVVHLCQARPNMLDNLCKEDIVANSGTPPPPLVGLPKDDGDVDELEEKLARIHGNTQVDVPMPDNSTGDRTPLSTTMSNTDCHDPTRPHSLPTDVMVDAQQLGLSQQLCDDLAVVLSSPRWQIFSWGMKWEPLQDLCTEYLTNSEAMRCSGIKELKYLHLDYSIFKDMPSDHDEPGIEKGYEQWAELTSSSDDEDTSTGSHMWRGRGRGRRGRGRRSINESDSDASSPAARHRWVGRGGKRGRKRASDLASSSISDSDITSDTEMNYINFKSKFSKSALHNNNHIHDKRKMMSYQSKRGSLQRRLEKRLDRKCGSMLKAKLSLKSAAEHLSHNQSPILSSPIQSSPSDLISLRMFRKPKMTSMQMSSEDRMLIPVKREQHSIKQEPAVKIVPSTVPLCNMPSIPNVPSGELGYAPRLSELNLHPNLAITDVQHLATQRFPPRPPKMPSNYRINKVVSNHSLNNKTILNHGNSPRISNHCDRQPHLQNPKEAFLLLNDLNKPYVNERPIAQHRINAQYPPERHHKYIYRIPKNGEAKYSINNSNLNLLADTAMLKKEHLKMDLARTIPGLKSLDLVRPPRADTTVQIMLSANSNCVTTTNNLNDTTPNVTTVPTVSTVTVQKPPLNESTNAAVSSDNTSSQVILNQSSQSQPTTPVQSQQPLIPVSFVRTTVPAGSPIQMRQLVQQQIGLLKTDSTKTLEGKSGHTQVLRVTTDHPSLQQLLQTQTVQQNQSVQQLQTIQQSVQTQQSVPNQQTLQQSLHQNLLLQQHIQQQRQAVRKSQIIQTLQQQPNIHQSVVSVQSPQSSTQQTVRSPNIQQQNVQSPNVQQTSVQSSPNIQHSVQLSPQSVQPSSIQHQIVQLQSVQQQAVQLQSVQQTVQLQSVPQQTVQLQRVQQQNTQQVVQKQQQQNIQLQQTVLQQTVLQQQSLKNLKAFQQNIPQNVQQIVTSRVPVVKGVNLNMVASVATTSSSVQSVPATTSLDQTAVISANEGQTIRLLQTRNTQVPQTTSLAPGNYYYKIQDHLFVMDTRNATGGRAPTIQVVPTGASLIPVQNTSRPLTPQQFKAIQDAGIGTKPTVLQRTQVQPTVSGVPMQLPKFHQAFGKPTESRGVIVSTASVIKAPEQSSPVSTAGNKATQNSNKNNNSSGNSGAPVVQPSLLQTALQGPTLMVSPSTQHPSSPHSDRASPQATTTNILLERLMKGTNPPTAKNVLVQGHTLSQSSSPLPSPSQPLLPPQTPTSIPPKQTPPSPQQTPSHAASPKQQPSAVQETVPSTPPPQSPLPSAHMSSSTLEQLMEFESVLKRVTKEKRGVQPELPLLQPQSFSGTPNCSTTVTPVVTQARLTQATGQQVPVLLRYVRDSGPTEGLFLAAAPALTSAGNTTAIATQTVVSGNQTTLQRPATGSSVVVISNYIPSNPRPVPTKSAQTPIIRTAMITHKNTITLPVVTTTTDQATVVTSEPNAATTSTTTCSKPKTVKPPSTSPTKTTVVTKAPPKTQEDEQTMQRIQAILDEYQEQLRNSPDLNNKPAPRRRSNPPTQPGHSSKRKKSPSKAKLMGQQSNLSDDVDESIGTTASEEDSTGGSFDLMPNTSGNSQLNSSMDDQSPIDEPVDIKPSLSALIGAAQRTTTITTSTSTAQETNASILATTLTSLPSTQTTTTIPLVAGTGTKQMGTIPLLMGGVRQVLLPVAPNLAASLQGARQTMVMKGTNLSRLFQLVTSASTVLAAVTTGKPITVTAGGGNVAGSAVVVRHVPARTPGLLTTTCTTVTPQQLISAATVKQVRLPLVQTSVDGNVQSTAAMIIQQSQQQAGRMTIQDHITNNIVTILSCDDGRDGMKVVESTSTPTSSIATNSTSGVLVMTADTRPTTSFTQILQNSRIQATTNTAIKVEASSALNPQSNIFPASRLLEANSQPEYPVLSLPELDPPRLISNEAQRNGQMERRTEALSDIGHLLTHAAAGVGDMKELLVGVKSKESCTQNDHVGINIKMECKKEILPILGKDVIKYCESETRPHYSSPLSSSNLQGGMVTSLSGLSKCDNKADCDKKVCVKKESSFDDCDNNTNCALKCSPSSDSETPWRYNVSSNNPSKRLHIGPRLSATSVSSPLGYSAVPKVQKVTVNSPSAVGLNTQHTTNISKPIPSSSVLMKSDLSSRCDFLSKDRSSVKPSSGRALSIHSSVAAPAFRGSPDVLSSSANLNVSNSLTEECEDLGLGLLDLFPEADLCRLDSQSPALASDQEGSPSPASTTGLPSPQGSLSRGHSKLQARLEGSSGSRKMWKTTRNHHGGFECKRAGDTIHPKPKTSRFISGKVSSSGISQSSLCSTMSPLPHPTEGDGDNAISSLIEPPTMSESSNASTPSSSEMDLGPVNMELDISRPSASALNKFVHTYSKKNSRRRRPSSNESYSRMVDVFSDEPPFDLRDNYDDEDSSLGSPFSKDRCKGESSSDSKAGSTPSHELDEEKSPTDNGKPHSVSSNDEENCDKSTPATRRSSQRPTHIRKGCPCCNGSPEPKKGKGRLRASAASPKPIKKR